MSFFNLVSMRVKVVLEGRRKAVTVGEGAKIDELLEKLGINRETVLVSLNGEIFVEEETLGEGNEVEIIRAISGG